MNGFAKGVVILDKSSTVFAFDISQASLREAKKNSTNSSTSNSILFSRMEAERLGLLDASFDLVLGNSILHHTDLSSALREVKRVLKKGGKALFVEPLNHNPAINAFRRLTPWRRSRYEKPLSLGELRRLCRNFSGFFVEGYYFLSVFAIAAYLIHGDKTLLIRTMRQLARFDNFVLHLFPKLNRYCFAGLIMLVK